MQPVANTGSVATGMEKDGPEIDDIESIIRIFRPRIFRFVLASLRDRDAAETVTQDCFLKAYQARGRFRGDCSIQTWLMQIAVNLIRDFGRNRRFQFWKRAQASRVDLGSVSDWIPNQDISPEDRAAAAEQIEAIWRVLGTLSERQRTVFLLHFMEDMDSSEIEAATGITRAAVKVHLFRAVHAIRKRLRKLE
jgi:RNA polymerase sigma-70 factor (ECF subfamily)